MMTFGFRSKSPTMVRFYKRVTAFTYPSTRMMILFKIFPTSLVCKAACFIIRIKLQTKLKLNDFKIFDPKKCIFGNNKKTGIITVNGHSPAEVLEVYEGALVHVKVVNRLMGGVSPTIHFHGLKMDQGYFWYDGVAGDYNVIFKLVPYRLNILSLIGIKD